YFDRVVADVTIQDDFDLCLSCVRRGDRCQAGPSQVHDLEPRRYNPATNKLEKGFFCDNEFCSENINSMFWHCKRLRLCYTLCSMSPVRLGHELTVVLETRRSDLQRWEMGLLYMYDAFTLPVSSFFSLLYLQPELCF